MNIEHPRTAASELPELSEARIDALESALFAEITHDRNSRTTRRRRGLLVTGAAAAVIVVAAVIAPGVGSLVGSPSSSDSAAQPAVQEPAFTGAQESGIAPDSTAKTNGLSVADGGAISDTTTGAALDGTSGRDIITTASATIVVDDVPEAARTIGDAATASGGYVESMNIDTSGTVPVDPTSSGLVIDTVPYPYAPNGAWITVRVPADQLDALVARLSSIGDVTASSVNRQDVSEQTVDLRARVDAARASVDRMTELLAQAANTTDLIAAESALAERQATLESYQQQLKYYDEQIAMSTLTVNLTSPVASVEANPAGFGDGFAAGWNGLVATLNGIVIAIGFLIPWILVIAVVGLIVWGVIRLVRRRKSEPRSERSVDEPVESDTP